MSSLDHSLAVSVRGLGKQYNVGSAAGALYDRIGGATRGDASESRARTTMWALQDVTFDVPRGHVLAVLGRNGSGKSTLMKLLARVTSPTQGEARVFGRVGALLEVGVGFHPELSGRDNIRLSGMILGMSKTEVAAVQEEIIEFAEVGRYLDEPVKHYSSGMYGRLAFSVSAHLAADILLIDEVLAVGDIAFQEKCQTRIQELVAKGHTVLLVSHSLSTVNTLCNEAIVLEAGSVYFAGSVADAVREYRELMAMPTPISER